VALDCAIYSIQPIITILAGFGVIMNIIQKVVGYTQIFANLGHYLAKFNEGVFFNFNLINISALFVLIMQFIYTPLVLALEKKLSLKIFLYYLVYPIYVLTWIPISVMGVIDKDKKEWSHTIHTRSVSINELEKAN